MRFDLASGAAQVEEHDLRVVHGVFDDEGAKGTLLHESKCTGPWLHR
jgi:hypothetical protein